MPKPFTILYPPVLNETILTFLPPQDLKNITASDQKDFEVEFYLQRPATKEVVAGWKRLVESLIATMERVSGAVLPADDKLQNDEERYLKIFKENRNVLFDMLEAYFADVSNLNEAGPFFHNLIMHFCIASHHQVVADNDAEKIIGKIFKSKNAEVFLNYLMQSDFKILADEAIWFKFLYNAILNDVSLPVISRLIQMGRDEKHFKKPEASFASDIMSKPVNNAHHRSYYRDLRDRIYVTPLFLALQAGKNSMIISLLIQEFPHDINPTLDALNKLKTIKDFTHSKTELSCDFDNHADVIASKTRLLAILDTYPKKHEIPLSSLDKEDSLNEIKQQLKDFKHPAECLALYDLHINACYINNHYRPKLDTFLRVISIGTASSYANTKKDFINSIRTRICDILAAGEFVGSFVNPSHYLETCKQALNHPVFSDAHDKQGVDTQRKLQLKTRIADIERTLNPVLPIELHVT